MVVSGRMLLVFTVISSAVSTGCGDSSNNNNNGNGTTATALDYVKMRDCPSCHEAPDGTLSGQTTAVATNVYSSNLTPDKETGLGNWTEAQITAAILDGIDDEGETLCSTMPAFKSQGMQKAEAQTIAKYLMGLAPVKHEIPESMCN
jgi:alcohol dehydrogenase (quinone), cytochrome c subunit